MKHLIMSLLLLSGVAAKAQNFAKFERGDTTFHFLPDYFDHFEFLEGTSSMDVGHIGKRLYTFKVRRETQMVYAVPTSSDYPAAAMTYPRSHHTHKHKAYTKTQDYRDLQEWVHKNRGRRNVIW